MTSSSYRHTGNHKQNGKHTENSPVMQQSTTEVTSHDERVGPGCEKVTTESKFKVQVVIQVAYYGNISIFTDLGFHKCHISLQVLLNVHIYSKVVMCNEISI